jgi:imidazolonepropionase-like amidohydrolase
VAQYTLDEMKAAVEAGVKCIEHGQLLDEPTVKLLGEKGIWLSLQALDEAPPTASPEMRAKKHTVVEGTDNAFKWAKKYNVKLAWGTDLMFLPAQMKNQNTDIIKLKAWMTSAEALKLVTHDNAQLLAHSGPRNPYPGKLGVVEVDALADLLLVDGDPIANLALVADPAKNFVVIMKDGKVNKNSLR